MGVGGNLNGKAMMGGWRKTGRGKDVQGEIYVGETDVIGVL